MTYEDILVDIFEQEKTGKTEIAEGNNMKATDRGLMNQVETRMQSRCQPSKIRCKQ